MKDLNQLINSMISQGVLKSPQIIKAFVDIDRKHFVPQTLQESAYVDVPLGISEGQTISQPITVAFMLESLSPQKSDKVLDIGSGSGWTTALLCHIVGEEGSVKGYERVDYLVEYGRRNLAKYCQNKRCSIQKAKSDLGEPREKFDKILVSAAAEQLPKQLIDQLKIGGKMVIPIKNSIFIVTKNSKDDFETEEIYGFRFVPLIY